MSKKLENQWEYEHFRRDQSSWRTTTINQTAPFLVPTASSSTVPGSSDIP